MSLFCKFPMLFNERMLILMFSMTQVRIAEHECLQSLFKVSMVWPPGKTWSRFYESSQQRYANVATVTWLARHFETVKFPITSSPRARPSNWANAELYRYKIVAVSLHKTHICVVKSLIKIAAVSWHSLRRFIKPAPAVSCVLSNGYMRELTSHHTTVVSFQLHVATVALVERSNQLAVLQKDNFRIETVSVFVSICKLKCRVILREQ